MKNIEVEYSLEATINTGNFENLRPGYRAKATLEEGENRDAALAKLEKFVENRLEAKVDEIHEDLRDGKYKD